MFLFVNVESVFFLIENLLSVRCSNSNYHGNFYVNHEIYSTSDNASSFFFPPEIPSKNKFNFAAVIFQSIIKACLLLIKNLSVYVVNFQEKVQVFNIGIKTFLFCSSLLYNYNAIPLPEDLVFRRS